MPFFNLIAKGKYTKQSYTRMVEARNKEEAEDIGKEWAEQRDLIFQRSFQFHNLEKKQ